MKAFLLLLILPVCAFGRLGETREQIHARYGAPAHVTQDGAYETFMVEDYRVMVCYMAGTSACETWVHRKKKAAITELVAKILETNGAGKEWTRTIQDGVTYFVQPGRVARLTKDQRQFTIAEKRFWIRFEEAMQKTFDRL